jgi:uroporphyrin-3 C-methyltransferase
MADIVPEMTRPAGAPNEPAAIRRVHSYSRLTTAIAVLGLATAVYALLRLDSTRDRLDRINDIARQAQADRDTLRAELATLTNQERQRQGELARQLDPLKNVPKQLQELDAAVEELHGRTEGPQRAWSRAEALYLMEIAQRSLTLHRDVDTAIVALQSADSRLSSLRDPGVTGVRQQLAREVQALRSVSLPDVTGIVARLASAEEQAGRASVKGIVVVERTTDNAVALPEGFLARARAVAVNALASLISVRKVDGRTGNVVTLDEQLIRRQHLQLLLFTARSAVNRHDGSAYRTALASARQWLGEFFELSDPRSRAVLEEIQSLEPVNIDPKLPEVSASARLLQQITPSARAAT